jgi:hypothetical protein
MSALNSPTRTGEHHARIGRIRHGHHHEPNRGNFDTLNTPSVRLNRTGYPDILAMTSQPFFITDHLHV